MLAAKDRPLRPTQAMLGYARSTSYASTLVFRQRLLAASVRGEGRFGAVGPGQPKHRFGRWSESLGFGIVSNGQDITMKNFTAVIERDADTGLYVGWVPGFPGAHSQGQTLDELRANLQEVVEMLLEEGDPRLESEFIGTQTVEVA